MTERKTPAELRITDHEYDALIWVRDALDPDISDRDLPEWIIFEMDHWGSLTTTGMSPDPICGTHCCLGGSMQMHMAGLTSKSIDDPVTLEEYYHYRGLDSHHFSSALDGLFYDYNTGRSRNNRRIAVAAIDRFLGGETSNPWRVFSGDDADEEAC